MLRGLGLELEQPDLLLRLRHGSRLVQRHHNGLNRDLLQRRNVHSKQLFKTSAMIRSCGGKAEDTQIVKKQSESERLSLGVRYTASAASQFDSLSPFQLEKSPRFVVL